MKIQSLFLGFWFFSIASLAVNNAEIEQLLGARVDERGITFQVKSNGCTYKRHFEFHVEERLEPIGSMLPALEHHHYITVKRLSPDQCEALVPYGTEIFMSYDDLGIQFGKFHIENPIGGDKVITVP